MPASQPDDTLDHPLLVSKTAPTVSQPGLQSGASHPGGPSFGGSGTRVAGSPHPGMAVLRSVCSFLPPKVPPPLHFGIAAIDARLPAGGLASHGLHELKPQTLRDAGSALALALALAAGRKEPPRPILMVLAGRSACEHGLPYGPGLASLGLAPERLILITAKRAADALWAIEEGLRARTLGAVIASLDAVAMLPARRLVLAADEGATPCFLLTGPSKASISVAHTRWRIASRPSAPHPFDPAAPGAWRCALTLERCRQGPSDLTWNLEWSDASYSFDLAAEVSAGALAAPGAGRRTG